VRLVLRILAVFLFLCAGWPASSQTADSLADDRQLPFWREIKKSLLGPDSTQFFENTVEHAEVPGGTAGLRTLVGTVLSGRPENSPGELVLALSDAHTPEVTLRFVDEYKKKANYPQPVAPGSKVAFEGEAIEFTHEPFMLIIRVILGHPRSLGPRFVGFSVLEEARANPKKIETR
jgi:hypothetical protein